MSRIRVIDGREQAEDRISQLSLRPRRLDDYIGQESIKKRLGVALEAARRRGEPLEHVLLYGPPGLGKTTLAYVISYEMKSRLACVSGAAIERSGDLIGILTNLEPGDVLFIDEIHRLPKSAEEFLYPAMEDFQLDFTVDKGKYARVVKIGLPAFTLVGATTRAGLVSAPLRDRFGMIYHLDFYPPGELKLIVLRSAAIMGVEIKEEAAELIAARSRGTPRVANRLLKRVRDYADVWGAQVITAMVAQKALGLEGIDEWGLDEVDRKYLDTLARVFGGGPVGIETLAALMNEEVDVLQEVVEPFLLKEGYVARTPGGRRITEQGRKLAGLGD